MSEKRNLHQRIAEVMQKVTYIQKERKKGMNYTIVSHDVVTAKVRPALLEAGVIYYPIRCDHSHDGNRAECSMTVRFANVDVPSDYIDVACFGYGVDNQDKGPGKAMSYAVKYALLKCLGLETGDDADHDSIDHEPAQKADTYAPGEQQGPADEFDQTQEHVALVQLVRQQKTKGDLDELLGTDRFQRFKQDAPYLAGQLRAEAKAQYTAIEAIANVRAA